MSACTSAFSAEYPRRYLGTPADGLVARFA